jgi:hypothetical protein
MSHAFLQAIYACARRHCADARRQENQALGFASCMYMPGAVGRNARRLFKEADRKRTESIRLALECRKKAQRLRRELARLASADTIPPPCEASA